MTTNALTIFNFMKSHPGEEFTKQDIAAHFDLLQNGIERGNLRAAVFKIDKHGEFGRTQMLSSSLSVGCGESNAEGEPVPPDSLP